MVEHFLNWCECASGRGVLCAFAQLGCSKSLPDVTFAPQLMRKHGRFTRQHACWAGRRTAAFRLLLTPEEQPLSVVGVRCVLHRLSGTGGGCQVGSL